jgi:phosphoribosylformimino-5-aminoimidazole carboxamide ribonucleotide (ProFAR) isomerase
LGREGFGGLGVTGTVTAVDANSITIQTAAGLTVTIGLDGSTTYHQQAPAAASDVTTGDKVQVQLGGGVRPGQGPGGTINLGTAGDVTIVP